MCRWPSLIHRRQSGHIYHDNRQSYASDLSTYVTVRANRLLILRR